MINLKSGMTINNLFIKLYFLFVFFICFNNSSVCLAKNVKNYNNYIGVNTSPDEDVDNDDNSGKLEGVMNIIKFIPGISLLVPSITCLTKAGLADFKATDITNAGDAMGRIFTAFTVIGNLATLSPSDAAGAIALQEVFSSNLYCKYQKIYNEENKYISKSKADNSEGGYPMFPIYPMNIPIKNGCCNVGDVLDTNFKQMISLNSSKTKCSFSFSATDNQCLEDINIPIMSEYAAQEYIVEAACLYSSLKKALKNATDKILKKEIKEQVKESIKDAEKKTGKKLTEEQIKEIENQVTKKMDMLLDGAKDASGEITKEGLEKLIKETSDEETKDLAEKILKEKFWNQVGDTAQGVGNMAATTTELFTDDRLAIDPINLIAVLMIQSTFEVLINAISDAMSLDFDCIISRVVAAQAVQYIAQATVAGVSDKNFKKARKNLPVYKFCGHNWLSYDKDWDYYDTNSIPDTYPRKGPYENSYYKKILDGIKDGTIQNNVEDRRFREYIYGGMEYSSGIPEKGGYAEKINGTVVSSDYDNDYCIDPRLSEISGIDYLSDGIDKGNIFQRYYMRGNDKGNFACNRFFYDGHSGCVVPGKAIGIDKYSNDESIKESIKKDNIYNIKTISNGLNYYEISGEKAIDICTRVFDMARKCCKYRSKHLVCIERIDNEIDRNVISSTFCFSHVIDGYEDLANSVFDFLRNRNPNKYGPTCKLDGLEFEATKKTNTDYVCVYSYGLCPYNFKLNAGLNYKASFCDSNILDDELMDDQSYLGRTATHFNAEKCKQGFFSKVKKDEYLFMESSGGGDFAKKMFSRVKDDMEGFNRNDFDIIYRVNKTTIGSDEKGSQLENASDIVKYIKDGYNMYNDSNYSLKEIYDIIPNSVTKTNFYGKVKNLCQYRAHCVEVEKEEIFLVNNDVTSSFFLDSSCTGRTSNSRNISPGHTGEITTQFSAPVVECIFESFKNLINGIAGVSLCSNNGVNNNEGYCGLDDEITIKTHINNRDYGYFESRYQKIDGTYIIKGQKLPDSYNPFYRLQKYLLRTIKAAFALFLVVFFYKKLLLGDLESFTKSENIPKLIFLAFKFSIVIWLIFYNGWQQGVYDKLVNFATSSYSFVNNVFVKAIRNPKNQILNFSGENKILRIVENNYLTNEEEPVMLCIKYDIFDNVTYSRRNIETKRCEKGFYSNYIIRVDKKTDVEKEYANIIVKKADKKERRTNENIIISNNQELSQLIYYVDQYNDKSTNKLKIQIKTGDGWSDLRDSNLWNPNYDGCYFDTTEYKDNKSYLAAFDTLDCKLARYLGYSVNMAAPNILIYSAIMLVPTFFFQDSAITKVINGVGGLIFSLMMTFIFMIFNIILKAVYIFASSFFNLSVLILLSPIILPLMFFERTKNVFDSWLEYIADSIFKPVLNFASLVIYINLMDIILLKNATFNNHSNKGKGAILVCPENSSSFVCLINGIPGVQQIKVLVNSNFVSIIMDIIIVFVFFKLSDQILTDIENISGSIFRNLSNDKQSLSTLSAMGTPMGKSIGDGVGSAMAVGAKLEEIRHDYINNAPGALFDKAKDIRQDMLTKMDKNSDSNIKKSLSNRVNIKERFNKIDGRFKTFKKAGVLVDGTLAFVTAPVSAALSYTNREIINAVGLVGEGLDKIREKRDQLLNKTNTFLNDTKRIASFKARSVFDKVTLKDYRDYQKVKLLLKENKSIYNDKLKNDRNIESTINKIKELQENIVNSDLENHDKLEKEIRNLKNKLSKLNDSKVNKKYQKNLDFIKNNLRGKYRQRFIEGTRDNIKKLKNKYNHTSKNKEKEYIIREIANNMDILDDLSVEQLDKDIKNF